MCEKYMDKFNDKPNNMKKKVKQIYKASLGVQFHPNSLNWSVHNKYVEWYQQKQIHTLLSPFISLFLESVKSEDTRLAATFRLSLLVTHWHQFIN